MAEGKSHGQMVASTRESMSREGSRGSGLIYGMMAHCIRGNGMTTRLRALEYTSGLMGGSMKAFGIKTIWMDMEHINGVMEDIIKDSIRMIRNMDLGYTPGPMGDSMKDIGIKGSNMGLDYTIIQKTIVQKQAFGRMASALSGLLMKK
jgi:hypothetical protein